MQPRSHPPLSAPRLAREALLVGLGWLLVALARSPGLTLHLGSRLQGHPDTDTPTVPWTLWHVAHSIATQGDLGVHTQLIGFPDGGSFWPMTPVEAVLLTPITLLAGPVLAANLLLPLHVALAGALLYALLRSLTGSWPAALAATPILALSPVLLCSAHNGNPEVSQLFWLPLVGLATTQTVARGGAWRTALGGALLALAAVSNTYVGLAAVVVAGALGLAAGPRHWRRLAGLLGVAALLAAPCLLFALQVSTADAALLQRSGEEILRQRLVEGQADLLGFVLPGAVRALGPDLLPTAFLNGWSTGLAALVLASLGLFTARSRLGWWALGLALVGALLALGPWLALDHGARLTGQAHIPLPYLLLDRLPPFNKLIELWRFAMVTHLAAAILAGLWLAQRSRPITLAAGALLLAEAMLLNPGPAAWRSTTPPDPELSQLVQGLEPGPVLHLPVRQGHWPLYFQTIHHQPVGITMANSMEEEIFAHMAGPSWSMESVAAMAKAKGYRWIILHHRPAMQALQPVVAIAQDLEAAGMVTRRAGDLTLVDVTRDCCWPSARYISIDLPSRAPGSDP